MDLVLVDNFRDRLPMLELRVRLSIQHFLNLVLASLVVLVDFQEVHQTQQLVHRLLTKLLALAVILDSLGSVEALQMQLPDLKHFHKVAHSDLVAQHLTPLQVLNHSIKEDHLEVAVDRQQMQQQALNHSIKVA